MTYLPNAYQGNDANRMMLSFFILSSMDLLNCLDSSLTEEDRQRHINWVYLCQHTDGGFRGFPGGDLGQLRNEENSVWDPANVPATFFALAILAVLRDDFSRVKRRECLSWLAKMQRPDGSFGETLGLGGKIEGGLDPRFGYTAMGIRAILRGRDKGVMDDVPDVDIDAFVECIRQSQVCLLPYYCRKQMLKFTSATMVEYLNHLSMNLMVRIDPS
jgi:geranylgeranyl transferase type-1 subunit beta